MYLSLAFSKILGIQSCNINGLICYRGKLESFFQARPFYRPEQVRALQDSSHKIMEKEVFRGSNLKEFTWSDIRGRCHVMFHRDYVTSFPEGFAYDDIWICACRYAELAKNPFPYIGNWRQALGIDHPERPVTLIQRPMPIQLRRAHQIGYQNQGSDLYMQDTSNIPMALGAPSSYVGGADMYGHTSQQMALNVVPSKTIGQYLMSPDGNMSYYQSKNYEFVTPDIGAGGLPEDMTMMGKPLLAGRSILSLPPPLPNGAKLLQAILVEDIDRRHISIALGVEPMSHCMDLNPEVQTLRLRLVVDDLKKYDTLHEPNETKLYLYQNGNMLNVESETDPTVFTANLVPGLNSLEVWATYNCRADAGTVEAKQNAERYSLRGHAGSGIMQESQQYMIFALKHV